MSRNQGNVILVLGMPGAGKSTLAKRLADVLSGVHISLGDLIRQARAESVEVALATEIAYQGRAPYQPKWLATLLQQRMVECGTQTFVIDGGPPMDRVAELLNLQVRGVLSLETPEAICQERFWGRKSGHEGVVRVDDREELFAQRSSWYREQLSPVLEQFRMQGLLYQIDGAPVRELVLQQALSCLQIADVLQERATTRALEKPALVMAGTLADTVETLRHQQAEQPFLPVRAERVRSQIDSARTHGAVNEMVLLCKPGLVFANSVFDFLEQRLHEIGYEVGGVALHSGTSIRREGTAQAHFNLHDLAARYGEAVLPEPSKGMPLCGSFSFAKQYGLSVLDKAWQKPDRLMQSIWAVEEPIRQVRIVNGHIPPILSQYEKTENSVIAILVRQVKADARSWKYMRREFLGPSDPAQAPLGSLRRLAFDGELEIEGTVCFQNNAFHLSAGPVEAYRELVVWFGRGVGERACATWLPVLAGTSGIQNWLYDRHLKTASLYQQTEEQNTADLLKDREGVVV